MGEILERPTEADQRKADLRDAAGGRPVPGAAGQSAASPAAAALEFPYDEAFSRNVGWVTREEQGRLRAKRVAIAGLGGVGGVHLLTLARLGIGHFRVADFDTFDFANFNRQVGATVSTVGLPKAQVLGDMARDINPDVCLEAFPEGVTAANVDAFLDGVDLYVDGLDFFAFDAREAVFAACARKGIPAITVAPLGMGAALLNFLPGQMSFEQYFRWAGCDETDKALRFLVGLSPSFLHARYLVDPSAVDFWARKGPSTGMACQLCAGIAGTEALKILLDRGGVVAAPRGVHFDAYRNTLKTTWRPWGNANPVQRLLLAFVRRRYAGLAGAPVAPSADPRASDTVEEPLPRWRGKPLESISHLVLDGIAASIEPWNTLLEAARWAPSGDNTQPWRFEVLSPSHLVVRGFDTRHWCVYDIDGRPSRIAIGAMLETLRIAAAQIDLSAEIVMRDGMPGNAPTFDVRLRSGAPARWPALAAAIPTRSVQRRAMSTQPLSDDLKRSVEAAVAHAGPFDCVWLEGLPKKLAVARLLSHSSWLRMTLAAAHRTHVRVIEWQASHSADRIPDRAIGLDRLTLRLMRWVLGDQRRALFFARWLGGTWIPRLQLDLIPAVACGAHLAIVMRQGAAATPAVDFALGAAVQRAWLAAESLGVRVQPEIAPLIFAEYGRRDSGVLPDPAMARGCAALAEALSGLSSGGGSNPVLWMCRMGVGQRALARSLRLGVLAKGVGAPGDRA
jgi:molybdopterin/thiamine biosynthesis adenylyltransferase